MVILKKQNSKLKVSIIIANYSKNLKEERTVNQCIQIKFHRITKAKKYSRICKRNKYNPRSLNPLFRAIHRVPGSSTPKPPFPSRRKSSRSRNKVNGSIRIEPRSTPFFSLPSHEIGRRKSGLRGARNVSPVQRQSRDMSL